MTMKMKKSEKDKKDPLKEEKDDLEKDLELEKSEENSEEEDEEDEDDDDEEDDEEGDDLETLKSTVKELKATIARVNAESAKRRRRIKELLKTQASGKKEEDDEKKGDDSNDRLTKLEQQLAQANRELQQNKMQRQTSSVVAQLNITFASEQAREDALELAVKSLTEDDYEEDGTVDPERLKEVVKKVVKSRPYLTTRKQAADVDATKKGASGGLSIDEEEIVRSFGIKS